MKRIMVLNGSSRSRAFTDSLIQSFKAGAESRGHEVTVMELRKMNIHPCIGCLHGGKNPDNTGKYNPSLEEPDGSCTGSCQ